MTPLPDRSATGQSYSAWFTDYPETHERRGQTVEVVPRELLDEARWDASASRSELDLAIEVTTMRLKAALERYGTHQGDCKAGPEDLTIRCTCGYHAALVANGVTPDEKRQS